MFSLAHFMFVFDSQEERQLTSRASVYHYTGDQWKQLDSGLSQVWFVFNPQTKSYKIIGCREDNQQVPFHSNSSTVFFFS
jgi:hypothetical protein